MFHSARRLPAPVAFLSGVLMLAVGASGCAQVDLTTALEISEFESGYHDAGITEMGASKLVPSVTFKLKNVSAESVNSVDMIVFFWSVEFEKPKELDEVIVNAINTSGVGPGALSDTLVVRSRQGFALEQQPRAELFNHRSFRDVTAKLFLKRAGRIVPAGEYTIDRRVLLGAPSNPASR